MRRSSLGKTLVGLTLALFALQAVSQSKDEALASIGDNNDEPSGWMRLEVAIFVDTSDEALASELWEVDPELGYPTNRRWLTDYAEIKALMDEWGEEAVNIDTNGAIAVVPSPPPQPDPDLNPENVPTSEEDTEDTREAVKIVSDDGTTLLSASIDDDLQGLSASLDASNGVTKISNESDGYGEDSYQEEAVRSNLVEQTPIDEAATSLAVQETEAAPAMDNGHITSTDQPSQLSAPNQGRDNAAVAIENLGTTTEATQQQSQDPGQIPLESLLAGNSEEANLDSEATYDATAIDALEGNIASLQTSDDAAFADERSSDSSSLENAVLDPYSESFEKSESFIADGGIAAEAPAEAQDDAGNFFAIEGLGEDFNGLVSGVGNSTGLSDGGLDTETIDWLSDFETEEASEGTALDAEPTPPPLPESYQAMPLEMLPAGLKKLEKDTGRRPVALLSWLQPIEGVSNAVIVDSWAEDGPTPHLQGTVRVSQATNETDGYRLTTDLWANTTAQYLPERLPAIEIPTAPTRVLVIEPEKAVSAEKNEASVEFIDISTGLNTVTPTLRQPDGNDGSGSVEVSIPPLKHAIRLNETRDLREGYVRYIDHPVIQVAAVWRELTYAELHEMGEAQRVRKDIDSLTRALVTQQSKKTSSNTKQQAPLSSP